MATIAADAISALQTRLTARMPASTPPRILYTLAVVPLQVRPVGIGAYVSLNADPVGEITGCRVAADALVAVTVRPNEDLNAAVATLTRTLLSLDPADQRRDGFLRLEVKSIAPTAATGAPAGSLAALVTLSILFEFLAFPQEAGDVIATIPQNVDLA